MAQEMLSTPMSLLQQVANQGKLLCSLGSAHPREINLGKSLQKLCVPFLLRHKADESRKEVGGLPQVPLEMWLWEGCGLCLGASRGGSGCWFQPRRNWGTEEKVGAALGFGGWGPLLPPSQLAVP